MRTFLIIALSIGFLGALRAQEILSAEDFMRQVALHHPMAKQADIQVDRGEAIVLRARGGFDPKASTDLKQKYYNRESYYSLLDAGLKVPTWFGLQFEGGYEQTSGTYLNAENNLPNDGLVYAGVSLPLGNGLLMDQRRAALRQAQVYRESTIVDRQILLNQLVLEAAETYWKWYATYNELGVYQEGLLLATQRYEAVLRGAQLGDRPFIDTLESGIQVQNRRLMVQEAELKYKNAGAQLQIYLWEDGIIPLELESSTVPPTLENTNISDVDPRFIQGLDTLTVNHPKLRQYRYKIDQLEIEQRFKNEQLKPTLNLTYNALSAPVNGDPFASYSPTNYDWGFEFGMPLFLRKERGDARLTRLKIQDADFELSNLEQVIRYKATAAMNDWSTSFDQVNLYRRTVGDYQKLVDGERQLFNGGESSLFLVNSREMNYMRAKIKLVELLAKNHMAGIRVDFNFGSLSDSILE